jgi:hypothetical protein
MIILKKISKEIICGKMVFFFQTGSHYINQDGPEIAMLLSQPKMLTSIKSTFLSSISQ